MLDAIINIPGLTNSRLNEVLLLYKQLITLDRAARHEKNVRIFDVNRVLKQKLVNNHLHGLKLRSHYINLCDSFAT